MTFFLDTDTCIYALRGDHPALVDVFLAYKPQQIKIPSMVAGELILGALHSTSPSTAKKAVYAFLSPFEIMAFDHHAAEVYAQVRAQLEDEGRKIGPNDLIIASTVLASRGILVTHNSKEFSRVNGLQLQDWVK